MRARCTEARGTQDPSGPRCMTNDAEKEVAGAIIFDDPVIMDADNHPPYQ